MDQCHGATCAAGVCAIGVKANAPCTDGDACTTGETCQPDGGGGGTVTVCAAIDQCHDAGTCDPTTGACSSPVKADGTVCDDRNACTQTDTCQGGVCAGSNPVICVASDQCHLVGTCDPKTGNCSNPVKANHTPCNDNDRCTSGETCQDGYCTNGTVTACPDSTNSCFAAGTCQSDTGQCSAETYKGDGARCGGVCANNVCCTPDNVMTCAGVCGFATNNCGQRVYCTAGCNVVCDCPYGGYCRVSPNKGTCCFTVFEQICADVDGRTNCQLP